MHRGLDKLQKACYNRSTTEGGVLTSYKKYVITGAQDHKQKGDMAMLNTSKIYQVVYDYLINSEGIKDLDDQLAKGIWDTMDPTKAGGGILSLIALCAALRDDMRKEANKANGKTNIDKVMRAIIKKAPKHLKYLQGAFVIDGRQYVTDSYRAIRLNMPIDLPAAPEPCPIDLAKLFAEAQRDAITPLTPPALNELRTYIKITKAENKAKYGRDASDQHILWDFGEDRPVVNAVYLLDILTAFPDAAITFSTLTAPLYFSHTNGEALLMPRSGK